MDAKTLLERAEAAVRAPTWPARRAEERAPAVPNLPAFFDRDLDRVVVFVGPAAAAVAEAVHRHHDATPKLARLAGRLAPAEADGVPVLRLALADWNEYLTAIDAAGLAVTEIALDE